jgi:hypothetical protein
MIEGWRPKSESIHLRFGIEYHQALHEYKLYRAEGASHDDAVLRVVGDLLERTNLWVTDHKFKNRDYLLRTVVWYLIISSDEDPAKTIYSLPAEELGRGARLRRRCRLSGGKLRPLWPSRRGRHLPTNSVADHKTTTPHTWPVLPNQFEPNNQMTSTLGRPKPAPIRVITTHSNQVGFSRFVRSLTYRTKDQLDEWLNDLKGWLRKAESYAKEGYWPMNDTACNMYGGCAFRQVCSKSPNVRGAFLHSHFTQEDPWNPLTPRGSESSLSLANSE